MNLFHYQSYREYLKSALPVSGPERGGRSKLAEHLGCQLGFVSLVLGGSAEFSLEHAFQISEFLSHTEEEREYFLLLVQKERAGSKKLEIYFDQKVRAIQEKRKMISERVIGAQKTLTAEDQVIYYSHWIYTALHMALMVPHLQNRDHLKQFLRIPKRRLNEAISFLVKTGLAVEEKNQLKIGTTRLHLSEESPLITRHHVNWRLQAMQALETPLANDLHYSSIMSVSEPAAKQLREMILEFIQNADVVIKEAKEQTVYSLCVDLFSLDQEKRQ